jgi:hypothetical protein
LIPPNKLGSRPNSNTPGASIDYQVIFDAYASTCPQPTHYTHTSSGGPVTSNKRPRSMTRPNRLRLIATTRQPRLGTLPMPQRRGPLVPTSHTHSLTQLCNHISGSRLPLAVIRSWSQDQALAPFPGSEVLAQGVHDHTSMHLSFVHMQGLSSTE